MVLDWFLHWLMGTVKKQMHIWFYGTGELTEGGANCLSSWWDDPEARNLNLALLTCSMERGSICPCPLWVDSPLEETFKNLFGIIHITAQTHT